MIGEHLAVAPATACLGSGWTTQRFKSSMRRLDRRNAALTATMMSLRTTGHVVPRASLGNRQEPDAANLPSYLLVEPGDLVVNPMWLVGGSIGVSTTAGAVSPDYRVFRPTQHVPRYLHYLLRSEPYLAQYKLYTRAQTTFDRRVQQPDLDNLPLITPPTAIQAEIADYLDRETAQIDTLIQEQQRLIDLLIERRDTTISSAIAEGVPGSRPMGRTRMPLRFAFSYQEGPGILAEDFRDAGVPLLRISGLRGDEVTLDGCNYLDPDTVESRWSHFRVERGDLLISSSASMGTVSEVRAEKVVGAIPYTGIIRLRPLRMSAEYIRWFVVSQSFASQVRMLRTGSTIQHFGPTHLSQMRVDLPTTEEQQAIARYLQSEIRKIDTLQSEAEQFIELSKERRTSLITAAVTGQIDLREVA